MANIKSQIKRNRQNETRRQKNKSTRSALRTKIKQFTAIADGGDQAATKTAYRDVSIALDKAASSGVIHKNNAANKKSRLSKRVSS
jgi:small subunit ribosomal protein S20